MKAREKRQTSVTERGRDALIKTKRQASSSVSLSKPISEPIISTFNIHVSMIDLAFDHDQE
jgi:hypothetical protein